MTAEQDVAAKLRLMKLAPQLMERLTEADELLGIAWAALLKMRLHGLGSDCSLSHEVRMFALHFSQESRDGPGALQVNGTGDFMKWRKSARALIAEAEGTTSQGAKAEGRSLQEQS
jgi:hypothetical protein